MMWRKILRKLLMVPNTKIPPNQKLSFYYREAKWDAKAFLIIVCLSFVWRMGLTLLESDSFSEASLIFGDINVWHTVLISAIGIAAAMKFSWRVVWFVVIATIAGSVLMNPIEVKALYNNGNPSFIPESVGFSMILLTVLYAAVMMWRDLQVVENARWWVVYALHAWPPLLLTITYFSSDLTTRITAALAGFVLPVIVTRICVELQNRGHHGIIRHKQKTEGEV